MFPGCQLASEWKGWGKRTEPVLVEPKLDGYRLLICNHADGTQTAHCRDEPPPSWAENVGHILAALSSSALRGFMFDGEVCAEDWGSLSKLLRRKRSRMDEETKAQLGQRVQFHVFDVVELRGEYPVAKMTSRSRKPVAYDPMPLLARRHRLLQLLAPVSAGAIRPVVGWVVDSEEQLSQLLEELIELEYEGAMIKETGAPYWFARSPAWAKVKPTKTMELTIVSSVEGEGKHAGRLGAFACVSKDGVEISVGTGLTDAQRADYWARSAELVGAEIEIRCQDDAVASARNPVFLRFRNDTNEVAG